MVGGDCMQIAVGGNCHKADVNCSLRHGLPYRRHLLLEANVSGGKCCLERIAVEGHFCLSEANAI